MILVQFPSPYFPKKDSFESVGGGFVYIGQPNFNPKIFGNRTDVVVKNQDGSTTTITPAGQPLTLTPGGLFEYLGAVVVLMIDAVDYSMTVDNSLGAQEHYFPSCVAVNVDENKAYGHDFSVTTASMIFEFWPTTFYVNPPGILITMYDTGTDGQQVISTTFNQTVIPGIGSIYTSVTVLFHSTMVGKTGFILSVGRE